MTYEGYIEKKKCPHCGAVITHDDPFCHKCLGELPIKDTDQPRKFGD